MKLKMYIGGQQVVFDVNVASDFIRDLNELIAKYDGRTESYGQTKEFKPFSLELKVSSDS